VNVDPNGVEQAFMPAVLCNKIAVALAPEVLLPEFGNFEVVFVCDD